MSGECTSVKFALDRTAFSDTSPAGATNRKAFTLIELLVVIAIIAVLLAVLMPGLRLAKARAWEVTCRANLKQWGLMYTMYANDNGQSLPAGWNGGTMWMIDLMAYYGGTDDVRLCPSARKFLHEIPGNVAGEFTAWGKFGDPGYFGGWTPSWGREGMYGSYGVNGWTHNPLDRGVAGTYDIPQDIRPLFWRKMTAPGLLHRVPLMGACMWDGSRPMELDNPPQQRGIQVQGSSMTTFCLDRHNGGPNMLLMDTSARKVGMKELWKLKWHKNWDMEIRVPSWPDWMSNYKDY